MRRDLADPELFGNEAGEDEDIEILNSYFLEKSEFDRFYSNTRRIAFVRSRKGMGKSALLRKTYYVRQLANSNDLVVFVKASDLFALQDVPSGNAAELIYGWQQRICSRINLELGAALNYGFTDDSILLIEKAELTGFRSRNLVSALFDRLKIKSLGLERTRLETTASQAITERVIENSVNVWVFIDDIDATFVNTESERLKVSTFFSACRNLIGAVQGLHIRASVRTDVWSILAQHDEALDKCEQYMLDLKWSTEETGRILENKIKSFFIRYYPDDERFQNLTPGKDGREIRRLVFKEPFNWGGRSLDSFRPIHILSAGRPRWAAQLCKLAGHDAFLKSGDKISIGHIRSVLQEYGGLRIADLYKEHRHQCARLVEIIESFSGGQKIYTTTQLLSHIAEKIIKHGGLPTIDGISAENGGLTIAHLLYRIGFITARNENDSTGLGFVRFEDRPNLLTSKTNLDDGLDWEIHPSYRSILSV
ncbi:hypothetical protein F3I62_07780 [Pseudomonas sp. R-28-1W-6]|uniref:P-loop ATPase, Sll1717 family n=1 Tax=Pseudomonas sp. R-28-1W-6 TaxID=2650101 RepID=UPI001365EA8B|nr:hypothetical protein [Pseudomonas sp. R-28-1W-6]MWV11985.1 hypothetical protein [Pseudomonas sp. R-28-1W-6]